MTSNNTTNGSNTMPQAAITPERHHVGDKIGSGFVLVSEWTEELGDHLIHPWGELLIVLRTHSFDGKKYSVIFDGSAEHFVTLEEAAKFARV